LSFEGKEGRGKEMSELSCEEWEAKLKEPVTLTPQALANRLHQMQYGKDTEHHSHHSCPCEHLAMFYLGVTESHGLFWPDGEGGNAWDSENNAKE
jgi:hypothetical protein